MSNQPRRQRKPNHALEQVVVIFGVCLAAAAILFAFYPKQGEGSDNSTATPTATSFFGRINADDGDPYRKSPVPTVKPAPQLSLELDLPDLDVEQQYWLKKARVIAVCPLCVAVDQPPINILAKDENAYTVWLALIYTESKFYPFVEGPPLPDGSPPCCYGLGQLGFSLRTAETDASPELNLYVSATEFARLIEANDGDLMESVRNYKGVQTYDTEWQSNSVWSHIRISGGR